MSRRAQRGLGAIAIIAILVILAALGSALVTTVTTQQSSLVLDLSGAKAYQSARAGIEYGIFQVLRPKAGCAGVEALDGAGAGATIAMTGNLTGFRATVHCTSNAHTEGSTTVTMSTITATACNVSSGICPAAPTTPNYVERQLQVSIGSN
jgi:MSHA biogenesis protein MshP